MEVPQILNDGSLKSQLDSEPDILDKVSSFCVLNKVDVHLFLM